MLSTGCNWLLFQNCASLCVKNISILGGILIAYNMALLMNDAHIFYHHIDALQSVSLAQSYFSHPEYLLVRYWVCAAVLFQYSINTFFILLKFSLGWWVTCMRVHLVTISWLLQILYIFVTIFPSP